MGFGSHMITSIMKRTAAFLFIFAVIVWGMNIAYHEQILSKYILARTDRDFAQYRSDVEVLFLGDSHAQHGLSTLDIPNAFNFSSQAEHYALNYYKLKSILAEGKGRLRVIVLPIDLHSFAARSLESNYFRDPWYWRKYVNYIEVARAFEDLSLAGRMLAAVFPFLGNGTDFFHPINPNQLTPEVRGFVQNWNDFSLNDNREAIARDRATGQLSDTNVFDDRLVAYFKKILALLADSGVNVILVRMPVTRAYFDEARRFIPSVDHFYETIDEMCRPYVNVMVVDYQKRFFGDDALFWDSDHVNAVGAEYLSLSVWRDYLERIEAVMPDGRDREVQRAAVVALRLKIAGLDRRRRQDREAKVIREMYRSGNKVKAIHRAEAAFDSGNHEMDILTLLLAAIAENGHGVIRPALAEALKATPMHDKIEFSGGRIVALGLTSDFWTVDGKPAYLAVTAPKGRSGRDQIWLSCYATGDALPLTATIYDGNREVRHTFREATRIKITLPEVSSGTCRLFVVRTDKTWVPEGGKDTRRLGVRIVPVEAEGDTS